MDTRLRDFVSATPLKHTEPPSPGVLNLFCPSSLLADGPFAASLPDALTPILNKYATALELEFGGEDAFLFSPRPAA